VRVFPAGVIPPEDAGLFAIWQPRYAEHGIVTFPVNITPDGDKRPAITGYLKIGPQRSAESAIKFANATAFGFACGPRNRILVVDMDDTDEAIVREGERLFGVSPILWRTGGGKFAMPFRHNGEGRLIRRLHGLPIDLLGGGYAVAPPSIGRYRPYEFLRGSLADLDRLPVARIPEEIVRAFEPRSGSPAPPLGAKQDHRNDELFRALLRHGKGCDDEDALLDVAFTRNADMFDLPLDAAEIARTTASAWQYERDGNNWVGKEPRVITRKSQFDGILTHPNGSDAFALYTKLRFTHWEATEFAASPKAMWRSQIIPGWGHQRYRNALAALAEIGDLKVVHEGGRGEHDPRLYSFSDALLPKGTKLVPNITRHLAPSSSSSLQGAFEAERQKIDLRPELEKSAEIAKSTKPRIAGGKR
jgi:hypothetical protein